MTNTVRLVVYALACAIVLALSVILVSCQMPLR